jgi:hypothetical protein
MKALMMEAETISETSINFYHAARRSVPRDISRRCENLKPHRTSVLFTAKYDVKIML